MAGSHKQNKAVFLFPSLFYRQDDFQTPLPQSVIDARHPQINGVGAQIERSRTTRYDCNEVDIIEERVDTEFARKRFQFAGTADQILGWLAMNYGGYTLLGGTPANEVQTIQSSNASAGTFKLTFTFEGLTGQTSALAYNISAANLQIALNKVRSIKNGGSVTVTGSLTAGFVITFIGRFAKADMTALIADSTLLTGTAISVTETTKGTNKKHQVSRAVSDILPYTSFIEAVIGDSTNPIEWYGFACDYILIEATKGGDLLVTVELIGKADTLEILSYTIPACINQVPINTKDCRVQVNGSFVSAGLSNFRFERRNGIVTSAEAFAFDSKELETNERGERPTETFSFAVQGSRGDALYTDAFNETTRAVNLMLGIPTERVTLVIPQGNLKLGNPDISYDGALKKSIINVNGQPYYDNTLQASSKVEANISRADEYLDTV